MYIQSFRNLVVWQKALELAKEIYRVTDDLPSKESFGLQSQMRRAAVSIPSNIAEGHRRGTKKDFIHFLRVSDGSSAELETQILICESKYPDIDFTRSKALLEEVQKMLASMIRKIDLSSQTKLNATR
ncbi:four helix bundle protein [Candidatus Kaiserbacteria bacterium]|nr:four helix bundle protein [Candidatus Kaiserbacteria bacterium]